MHNNSSKDYILKRLGSPIDEKDINNDASNPSDTQDVFINIEKCLPEEFTLEWIAGGDEKDAFQDVAVVYCKQKPIAMLCVRPLLDTDAKLRIWCAKKKKEIGANELVGYTNGELRVIDDAGHFVEGKACSIEDFFKNLNEEEEEIPPLVALGVFQLLLATAKSLSIKDNHPTRELLENLITDKDYNKYITIKKKCILLKSDIEDKLFTSLIGTLKDETLLCRYTTLSTIIRIISTKKASVTGIACMNDKSECYYVDQYLNGSTTREKYLKEMSEDKVNELNSYFIMSCSKKEMHDKLPMWRMYGDDAKGVCITYKINKDYLPAPKEENKHGIFYLAPVNYADENNKHWELDFIKKIDGAVIAGEYTLCLQRLKVWEHFFKPYDYKDENEVRLLYRETDTQKYKWITTGENILCPVVEFDICDNANCTRNNCKTKSICDNRKEFPLVIEKIMLGPKCPERNTNVAQLRCLASLNNIKCANKNIEFSVSDIDNYR